MRVIAGQYRGRRLKTVQGQETRPTSDKVKESIFQMIGPYFDGGYCLDLFAGSGALAIEALSRGMDKAILIEKSKQAIKTIYDNVKGLNLTKEQAEVYRTDALRALYVLQKRQLKFDLIFIDPPYGKLDDEKIVMTVIENDLLMDDGIIYYEYATMDGCRVELGCLTVIKQVNYGTTGITLFKKV